MRLMIGLLSPLLAALALADSYNGTSMNTSRYAVSKPPLTTPWTYKAGTNPWPEYPRPQLQRPEWKNLNGIWKYQNASSLSAVDTPPFRQNLAREVLVPSCLESGLSGKFEYLDSVSKLLTIERAGIQGNYTLYSWFSTSFTVPKSWSSQRVLLNFGAIDYEATVFVNGHTVAFNRGGYFHFTVDTTDYLSFDKENELYINSNSRAQSSAANISAQFLGSFLCTTRQTAATM